MNGAFGGGVPRSVAPVAPPPPPDDDMPASAEVASSGRSRAEPFTPGAAGGTMHRASLAPPPSARASVAPEKAGARPKARARG